jgi:hypothetical protein
MRGFLDASAEMIRGPDTPRFSLMVADPAARKSTFLLKEKA